MTDENRPGKNGWTGGQYSLYRGVFGCYLFIHFVRLVPWGSELFSWQGVLPRPSASPLIHLFPNILAVWDGPAFVQALLIAAAGWSVLFAIGAWDRAAAIAIWYLGACLLGRNPLIANPALPFIGWLLLAHAFLPASPYGSWAARGRPDPRGRWKMTPSIFLAAWILMSLGYTYSGAMKLGSISWVDGSALWQVLRNPLARPGFLRESLLACPPVVLRLATWGALGLELGFAPLVLFRKLRPWVWGAMLLMHVGLLALVDFADLTAGMAILHWFTFDPAWIPFASHQSTEIAFYDGHCGLCHRAVRFVLAEDRQGTAFRFAPLQGETFAARVMAQRRAGLPDSIVVQTADGELLVRSSAFIHILERLGGTWRILAAILAVIPRPLRDAAYDFIARIRYSIFGRRDDVCPVTPPELRARFDP
jgi:predicted DCC family thiol-disulfide oxidoreductase YuxK